MGAASAAERGHAITRATRLSARGYDGASNEETRMQTVVLPGGEGVPALGLGTWRLGESTRARAAEVAAVRLALQIGCRLIDTAEMYGEGGAEEVVGEAVAQALAAGE